MSHQTTPHQTRAPDFTTPDHTTPNQSIRLHHTTPHQTRASDFTTPDHTTRNQSTRLHHTTPHQTRASDFTTPHHITPNQTTQHEAKPEDNTRLDYTTLLPATYHYNKLLRPPSLTHNSVPTYGRWATFTPSHRRAALPADIQILVWVFFFVCFLRLFYSHCYRSYSFKCSVLQKMKARTSRGVILFRPLAFESRIFF